MFGFICLSVEWAESHRLSPVFGGELLVAIAVSRLGVRHLCTRLFERSEFGAYSMLSISFVSSSAIWVEVR